jgi:hypothetical protein
MMMTAEAMPLPPASTSSATARAGTGPVFYLATVTP